MKKILLIAFLLPLFVSAQEYVDLLKVNYSETLKNNFQDMDKSTTVKIFNAGLIFPIVLNENQALITGADFNSNNLQLFPEAQFTNLYSTNLKLGLASTWSEKYSTTVVLLPKIASDYKNISDDDFYLGVFALLNMKKNENLKYRFAVYVAKEAFGVYATPIVGWYYLSPNQRFEMDMSLPIAADINYKLGKTNVGIDYYGIGKTFKIHNENTPTLYVDHSSLEFSGYFQYNLLEESVLLRAKAGYSTNKFEVYNEDDKIDFRLSAFSLGDDRTQLNTSINGSIFFRIEAVYRFHIRETNSETPNP
ncbi:hypothetical protein Aeqsu_1475 [Aequorivita sublithincola DSM 14238]|uniref:DUF6268 domain-containing protein n=1 Tax=Aequorivita sublithincola (strain DSM 14238 / LMG 21431 / ACAM 643 / 9-3) TaxID=746697 RepID=I3YVE8_AEQSU|nr:DUF6268 family outer membrane beta-barrel protein [Aequorivita sublithincola]AFL80966.1 hypothetical protein Aeqsu_1475 [Aequorivita sublithincola DSM 14238]